MLKTLQDTQSSQKFGRGVLLEWSSSLLPLREGKVEGGHKGTRVQGPFGVLASNCPPSVMSCDPSQPIKLWGCCAMSQNIVWNGQRRVTYAKIFVLSCLAMILIGGPCPIVLHPPKQFILQIIVNLKKSDFSSLSPPAELTIVQLHHRSAAWASSGLAALQILCYLALVLSPGPFIERRAFPRIEGPAPHFWEKLTGSAPRSEESARAKALVKLPFPKIEGPAPQFWEKAPP